MLITYMEFKNRQNQSTVIEISIVVVPLVGVERMTKKHRKHVNINKYIHTFKIPCAICKRFEHFTVTKLYSNKKKYSLDSRPVLCK